MQKKYTAEQELPRLVFSCMHPHHWHRIRKLSDDEEKMLAITMANGKVLLPANTSTTYQRNLSLLRNAKMTSMECTNPNKYPNQIKIKIKSLHIL